MRIIFLFLLIQSVATGQSRISKATYQCTTHLFNGNVLAGKTVLYFTDTASLYIHKDFPKSDLYEKKGNNVSHVISYKKGDAEGLPVYISLKDSTLIYKSEYPSRPKMPFFAFKENLPSIKWQIQKERKFIAGLSAVLAVGVFGNRTYEVWFSPDIPVSYGPYKLWGLPGLILEAKSLDEKVKFEFAGWEEVTTDKVVIAPPQSGRLMTQKQFKEFLINELLRVEARNRNVTNNDPPADYTIEKNKFTYLVEYKRKRGRR